MPVIETLIDPNSPAFAQTAKPCWRPSPSCASWNTPCWPKPRKPSPSSTSAGQLLPRERLNLLLDPGAPFLELASWLATNSTTTKTAAPPVAG